MVVGGGGGKCGRLDGGERWVAGLFAADDCTWKIASDAIIPSAARTKMRRMKDLRCKDYRLENTKPAAPPRTLPAPTFHLFKLQ